MDRPRELAGLEQEQHPPREVAVTIGVQPDILDETLDVEGHAEHGVRAWLALATSKMLLRQRHGANHVDVVIRERATHEHRPVVVAPFRQLSPRP